jgi:YD repeat-containing protein
LTTKDGVVFRCLFDASGQEFFEAVTPDGTRYRFDHMVSRSTTQLTKSNPNPEFSAASKQASKQQGPITAMFAMDYFINRSEVWILPTLVTDRFGNTVTYAWDTTERWKLLSITASDGRQLTLSYVSGTRRVEMVCEGATCPGARHWSYSYAAVSASEPRLSHVTQPDGSQWTFELGPLREVMWDPAGGGCGTATSYPANGTGTMTHPSGAQGTFAVAATQHGRSYVPSNCINGSYAYHPAWFETASLTSKTISGPGMTAMSWSYAFAENSCYVPAPDVLYGACTSASPTSKTVTVTTPNGVTRYTFGNRFRNNEGQLLKVEEGFSGSSALRTTDNLYADSNAGPWAAPMGTSIQSRGAGYMNQWHRPLATRTIAQQGRTFTWQVNSTCGPGSICFDEFARPLSVTRSSSTGASRTDVTDYYDHLGKWVLGQIESVANSGLVQSNAIYDSAIGVPTDIFAFGKLQQKLTYHTDGTIHTVEDGRGNTTTLTSWKRGVPQNILFADNTTKSAIVNDSGSINSVTDQNGHTTSYGQDSMGRLSSITYPTADDVAWNSKSLLYEQVGAAEYASSPATGA